MGVPFIDLRDDDCTPTMHTGWIKSNNNNNHNNIPCISDTNKNLNCKRHPKDFVGNCKEYRIDSNRSDLRIIGNGNRIRINDNSGDLNIIGNTTRLKINKNSGNIKYTGNDGRICLGSDSSQQVVDYIGCNGILKVVNSVNLNSSPQHNKSKDNDDGNCEPPSNDKKSSKSHIKSKSTAFVGDTNGKMVNNFGEFIRNGRYYHRNTGQVHIRNNIPLPNLSNDCSSCSHCCRNSNRRSANTVPNNINISHSIGDIVIQNSVNVSFL